MLNPTPYRSTSLAVAALVGLLVIGANLEARAEPQTRPPTTSINYDRSDELKITGQIHSVEVVDGETIVWVTAKKVVKQGVGAQPGAEARGKGMLWRVEGPGLTNIKVREVQKLVAGAKISVTGFNAADKSCDPHCKISSRSIKLS